MASSRTCLVLGGRDALAKLDAAISTALEAAGLRRVLIDSIDEFEEALKQVDIVLADVSKVSPSVSFELGAAKSLGVRALYIARQGTRVPPVFDPVLFYNDSDSSPVRLGFVLARALEDTLSDRPFDIGADAEATDRSYRPGDRFVGFAAHVDSSGYVLVAEVGRRPVLLPFSLMIDSDLLNRGERVVREGDLVLVDVDKVDEDRVTVREAEALLPARLPLDLRHAQSVMQASAMIGSIFDTKDAPEPSNNTLAQQRAFEWVAIHPSASKRLRQIRNALSHGAPVDAPDLAEMADISRDLLDIAFQRNAVLPDATAPIRFLDTTHEIERTLEALLRLAGAGLPARTHGLRALGAIAERCGAVPAEIKEALGALGRVRNELVHDRAVTFESGRLEFALALTTSVNSFLRERYDTLAYERQPDQR